MSEPITRADMAAIIEAVRNTGFPLIGWNGGPIPPNPFATMADAMAAALSASPPRAPVGITGPVLPVESGPGQPTDIVSKLKIDANSVEGIGTSETRAGNTSIGEEWQYTADLEREAATEITRLRTHIARDMERADNAYRAGIEAAAQVECACCRDGVPLHRTFTNAHVLPDGTERVCVAYRIRALADKPVPDALLAGIEHVREHLRTDGNAVRLIAWLDAEIAARKGG